MFIFILQNTKHKYLSIYDFIKIIIIRIFTSKNLLSINKNYSDKPIKTKNKIKTTTYHQSRKYITNQNH